MKRAGKYSGGNILDILKNIGRGQKTCAEIFKLGMAPFCPWHDKTYVIDLPEKDFTIQEFRDHSIAWLEVSDCVYVISGQGENGGVDAELDIADKLHIPVFTEMYQLIKFRDKDTFVRSYPVKLDKTEAIGRNWIDPNDSLIGAIRQVQKRLDYVSTSSLNPIKKEMK